MRDPLGGPESKELVLTISQPDGEDVNASASVVANFNALENSRGEDYQFIFEHPVTLVKDVNYQLQLALNTQAGEIVLEGSAPAHESSWDDGIPYRLEGYDAYGGIYKSGLNFEMYWPDNQEKYERFVSVLDEADFIFITSSRQWGSLPRVPERYPLSTVYYRNLLGCPPERSIEWCFNVAQPGMFKGSLGFDLVNVFQSDPSIGPWSVNDQPSEEAFTVYDHPKVLIFRKSAEYDSQQVREILGSVNLSQVVHVTPKQADSFPANLLLPSYRWAEQVAGGTWSSLFTGDTVSNQRCPEAAQQDDQADAPDRDVGCVPAAASHLGCSEHGDDQTQNADRPSRSNGPRLSFDSLFGLFSRFIFIERVRRFVDFHSFLGTDGFLGAARLFRSHETPC